MIVVKRIFGVFVILAVVGFGYLYVVLGAAAVGVLVTTLV